MSDSTRPLLIADEVTALGYRLAGVRVVVPALDELASVFERALGETTLILITPEYASRLPAKVLGRALSALSPLVLIVPDMTNRTAVPDLGARVRSLLGMSP